MIARLTVLTIFALAAATDVRKCSDNKPFPLAVRVHGCEKMPCDIIKGRDIIFEIDFVASQYITLATTQVRATTLGLTVPYELPKDVADVCSNLMYEAYCPLYPTEDVTYLFVFFVGNYPEIGVKVEISIVDQNKELVTCFSCDIKVKKGKAGDERSNHTIYEIA